HPLHARGAVGRPAHAGHDRGQPRLLRGELPQAGPARGHALRGDRVHRQAGVEVEAGGGDRDPRAHRSEPARRHRRQGRPEDARAEAPRRPGRGGHGVTAGWTPPGPAMLFCPADRPERYGKAAERADVVIVDLEDAVAPENRTVARDALRASELDPARTIVRVNPADSADHAADLEALAATGYRCVMLAKTESAAQVTDLYSSTGAEVLALVETPLGVVRAPEIASAPGCDGLMWGAEDLLAAMGGSTSRFAESEAGGARFAGQYRDVPRHARARVALAAAAFGRWAVDSVHLDIADEAGQRAEALDAVARGFVATACIPPSQVATVRQAYAPDDDEVAWARRVLDAARGNQGVFQLDGRMIGGPVFRQAEATLRRAAAVAE